LADLAGRSTMSVRCAISFESHECNSLFCHKSKVRICEGDCVEGSVGHPSCIFVEVRILKDFKSFVYGSADSKGVTGCFMEVLIVKELRKGDNSKWS
jgi:hypothetical protein